MDAKPRPGMDACTCVLGKPHSKRCNNRRGTAHGIRHAHVLPETQEFPYDNFMRYLLLIGAAIFVGVSGVEGFAYTIILYFILSALNLSIEKKSARKAD